MFCKIKINKLMLSKVADKDINKPGFPPFNYKKGGEDWG